MFLIVPCVCFGNHLTHVCTFQVTIQPIDAMINHNTNSVFIEDLFVPQTMRIGEVAKAALTKARIYYGYVAIKIEHVVPLAQTLPGYMSVDLDTV